MILKPCKSLILISGEVSSDRSYSKLLRKSMKKENIIKALDFKCSCECLKSLDFSKIITNRYKFWSKPYVQRQNFLIDKMKAGENGFIIHDSLSMCKKAFCIMFGINKNTMTKCRRLLKDKKESCVGRNLYGHSEKVIMALDWLEQYATHHGDRMPDSQNILLPYRTTKVHVFESYRKSRIDLNLPATSQATFMNVWKNRFPHLKIKQVCVIVSNFSLRFPYIYIFIYIYVY